MSTKLYDGLLLTEHAPDIYDLTRMISARMRGVFRGLAEEIVAQHVVKILDDQGTREKIAWEQGSRVMLSRAAEKLWLEEQDSLNPNLAMHDPLRFSIVFGRADDSQGVRRLAYPFSARRAYTEALMALTTEAGEPIFEDYHYQNQTDRPDDVPEQMWDQRRNDWDQVLDAGDPATKGTLGHLPGWQLPNTIRDVFGTWMYWSDDLDLNRHACAHPTSRLRQAIVKTAWETLKPVEGTGDRQEIFQRSIDLHDATRTVIDEIDLSAVPMPAPLPDQEGLLDDVSGLPPVYEPPGDLVDLVVARLKNA